MYAKCHLTFDYTSLSWISTILQLRNSTLPRPKLQKLENLLGQNVLKIAFSKFSLEKGGSCYVFFFQISNKLTNHQLIQSIIYIDVEIQMENNQKKSSRKPIKVYEYTKRQVSILCSLLNESFGVLIRAYAIIFSKSNDPPIFFPQWPHPKFTQSSEYPSHIDRGWYFYFNVFWFQIISEYSKNIVLSHLQRYFNTNYITLLLQWHLHYARLYIRNSSTSEFYANRSRVLCANSFARMLFHCSKYTKDKHKLPFIMHIEKLV